MKSFAIDSRKSLSRASSGGSSLHAPSNDDYDSASISSRGVAVESPTPHLRDTLNSSSIPHFTAAAGRERCTDGAIIDVTIPHLDGKLTAGFGVKLFQDGSTVVVEHLFHDCPAERAGLTVTDRIVQIDNEEIHSIARAKLLLETQNNVTLVVQRLSASATPSNRAPLHT